MSGPALGRIEPRMIVLVMASAIVLTALAAYLYLFKPDLKALAQLAEMQDRALSSLSAKQQALGSEDPQALRAEVDGLEDQLFGKQQRLPPAQMVSYIISELDHVSRETGVELLGVKPGAGARVLNFDEIPFDIEVRGAFAGLYRWLRAAEQELRPMVVKQFHMLPNKQSGRVDMHLRVVSYRPGEDLL